MQQGPATETRLAVIDPKRGIVIGYAMLFYGNSTRRMQIGESFKMLDGRIRLLDKIGLMEEGITAPGFTHWSGEAVRGKSPTAT